MFSKAVNLFTKKKSLVFLLSFIFIVVFIITLANSFAIEGVIGSINFESNALNYSVDEGSWMVTVGSGFSSKERGKANVVFNVKTKPVKKNNTIDLVLLIDDSITDQELQNSISLIDAYFDENDTYAIIKFNSEGKVVSDFSSSVNLDNSTYGSLDDSNGLSYYAALDTLNKFLSERTFNSEHELDVLLITDGVPATDIGKEKELYSNIRENYPELENFYAVQYNENGEFDDTLKQISDGQFVAKDVSSFSKIIHNACMFHSDSYDMFNFGTVISNEFTITNINQVSPYGKVNLVDSYISWEFDKSDLSNQLFSGTSLILRVELELKDEYKDVADLYPVLDAVSVEYGINGILENVSSSSTPIISNSYSVIYNGNAPTDCIVSNLPNTVNNFVGDSVSISDKIPVCNGYQFKGWEANVTVKNNSFTMPNKDVTLTAKWSKASLGKSMDGTIAKSQNLYRIVAEESRGVDTSVDFSAAPTTTNSGVYTLSGTEKDQYPVHYYRGIIDNNNVLFANFCWKVVRTTSTGGVKLIYNGIPDENGSCNNTGLDSQLSSTSPFNTNYNSPADVGYMYGTRYTYRYGVGTTVSSNVLERYSPSSNSNYYYGSSVTYSNGTYTLLNASQKTWVDNYNDLVGYYTCRSTSTTCSSVYYIVGSTSNYQYVMYLSGGITDPTTKTITFGKNVNDNGNGTYSLTELVNIKIKDWFTTYSAYKGYYVCWPLTSTTCNGKYLITSTSNYELTYDTTFNYIYGNDVSWDGSKYTLIDTFTSTNFWQNDKTTLAKKYHYTCFNTTGECTTVYYIYSFGFSEIYNLALSSGTDIEAAKEEMFANINNSAIKEIIDTWYEANMTSYTKKLEDTIWCNDRTLYSGSLVGKDNDAGTDDTFYFSAYNRVWNSYNPSVTCPNEARDGFTVSMVSGGNGALTYPVGLLTADEVRLAGAGENCYLRTGQNYWNLSPTQITNITFGAYVLASGYLNIVNTVFSTGIRPAISLTKGTKITGGDGTVNDPYVIDMDS